MATVRLATRLDAQRILEIYSPFCADSSAVSFETEPPSTNEMENRLESTLKQLPWLILEENNLVLAYAYASMHKQRAAYRWSVDVSVYVAAEARRIGAGTKLYAALFSLLRSQGYINAYAGITLPNPGSVALHESMGFRHLATYTRVGYKGGAWHDVAWFELQLAKHSVPQAEPQALPYLLHSRSLESLL